MANLKSFTAAALLLCSSTLLCSSAVVGQGLGAPAGPGGPGGPKRPAPPVVDIPDKEFASSQEEYDARLKAAHGGTKLTRDTAPDWSGIWTRDGFDEPSVAPQLTPKYQQALQKKLADEKAGKGWDRLSDCLPTGVPRWLAEPWMREFIVTPTETWMTHEQINEIRRIYTDGRPHVTENIPLWMGDSIGFWDKDTLVMHTNHLKAGEYRRGRPDFSFNVSTVERWRMTAPGVIEVQATIYDPDSLVKPFHEAFRYRTVTDGNRINYMACEENNNTFRNADGTPNERLPGEPGFRYGPHFGIPEVAWDSMPE